MPTHYSQTQSSASYRKSKSLVDVPEALTSVVFSLLFPVIFIVVFGSMVDNAAIKIKVGIAQRL